MEQQNNKKIILICSLVGFGFLMALFALIIILTTPKELACTAHYDFDCDLLCDTCKQTVDTSNSRQHRHVFSVATCTEKSKCICGETTGNLLEHEFVDANCTSPKTCTKCGLEEGEKLGHDWKRYTCDQPEVCTKCNSTRGTGIPHSFLDGYCIVCNAINPNVVVPHEHVYDNACDASCNTCIYTREVEHSYGEWNIVFDATLTTEGYKQRQCMFCGIFDAEEIPVKEPTPLDDKTQAMFNRLFKLLDFLPTTYTLNNIQTNQYFAEIMELDYYEKVVDGTNNLHKAIVNGVDVWTYSVIYNNSVYNIVYHDGSLYNVSQDGEAPTVFERRYPTGDESYYDVERDLYVVDAQYLLELLYNGSIETDNIFVEFLSVLLMPGVEVTIEENRGLLMSDYVLRANINDDFEIFKMTLNPSLLGVASDFYINVSPLFNGLDNMIVTGTLDYDLKSGDDEIYIEATTTWMYENDEPIKYTFFAHVLPGEGDINVEGELKDAIDSLSDEIDAAIDAKYDGAVLCNKPLCGNKHIAIYDEELDVYIQLSTDFSVNGFLFISGYSKTLDNEKYCLLTINADGTIVSVQHCTPELSDPTTMILDKYMGLFACTDACGNGSIVIYDEEFGLYVMFDEDFWNKGYYEVDEFFGPTVEEYDIGDCLGVIDFENRTITITKHSELHEYMNSIDDVYFTVIGLTNNCDLAIPYKEGYYILCYEAANGKYYAAGTFRSTLSVSYCTGVVDVQNQTITITQHRH